MNDLVPPTRQALLEALTLSEEILRNIELDEISLSKVALKTSRLARLLNDAESQRTMQFEASGYPISPNGVPPDVYQLAVAAGREYEIKDPKTGKTEKYIYATSIAALEQEVATVDTALAAAKDPDVAISSANPNQHVLAPSGNSLERSKIKGEAFTAQHRLASRVAFIHEYTLRRNHELKFSGIAGDIFSRLRERVDRSIGDKVPEAVRKLSAVYENLTSENVEDWSNAVHSCRRILQDLADAIYPPRADVVKEVNGKARIIKLGPDQYVNRIVGYVEEHSSSERFSAIVGSHLGFLGERLDSVFAAAQKGSHADIVTKEEADRYVVYTYLVVGDVLSLT